MPYPKNEEHVEGLDQVSVDGASQEIPQRAQSTPTSESGMAKAPDLRAFSASGHSFDLGCGSPSLVDVPGDDPGDEDEAAGVVTHETSVGNPTDPATVPGEEWYDVPNALSDDEEGVDGAGGGATAAGEEVLERPLSGVRSIRGI